MTPREEDFALRAALRPASMRASARLAQNKHRVRRKPRTSEESAMLMRMALASVRERKASGRLVRVGLREYVLHPRVRDPRTN